jgi:hypothetical protein
MTQQERALVQLIRLLDKAKIPYMVIGGLANAIWGQPRSTLDIDITIWAPATNTAGLLRVLARQFTPLVEDPEEFVARTRVLPVKSRSGVKADLIFGGLPLEEEAIHRATAVPMHDTLVRFCTAEDLILHKIISDRERDQSDVQGVLSARLEQLDLSYLEPRIRDLAGLLDRSDIWERWLQWKKAARA